MKISVVIPCRNERRHIREFLDSLMAQQLDADCGLEILVADGMSDDGTRQILKEYSSQYPNVRMIDNPGRIVSTGLNAAIQAATGELVIRMDAHTVYASDYICECARASISTGADNVGGPWVAKGKGLLGRAIAAAFQIPFCTGGGKAHDPAYEGEVDTVYLGCWRRPLFDKVGLFDPDLVRNQDDEFNFRLHKAGARIWQSPRVKSVYTPRASLTALFRQYMQYGFWKVAVMRKHHAVASLRHLVPTAFVLANAGLLALAIVPALRTPALLMWLGMLGCYLGLASIAAVAAARKEGWDLLPVLPAVIFTYHLSYGLGFLSGLVYWPAAARSGKGAGEMFTKLTR